MITIRRIGILSLANVYGLLSFIMGLILGLTTFAFSNLIEFYNVQQDPFYQSLGFWVIVLLPILYGVVGFLAGALGALLYNLVAKYIGGIELETDKK